MVILPYLSTIRLSGQDAGEFLHNQVSADVLGLADGESTFACYCEPKGRVLALMLICRVDDTLCAVMASSLVQSVVPRLKMYVMRSQVNIETLDNYVVSGVPAGLAEEMSADAIAEIPSPDGELLFVVVSQDKASTADPAAQHAWKSTELKRGICWLNPEASGQFLPQMLGFDELGAVNFRKGCYPGQEIVARTRYLGKVKRHPRILELKMDTCPATMEKLELTADGKTDDAVIVDCVKIKPTETLLFIVSRLGPDLITEQVGFQGQLISLVK
jgi:folate-binding protein YgfZ